MPYSVIGLVDRPHARLDRSSLPRRSKGLETNAPSATAHAVQRRGISRLGSRIGRSRTVAPRFQDPTLMGNRAPATIDPIDHPTWSWQAPPDGRHLPLKRINSVWATTVLPHAAYTILSMSYRDIEAGSYGFVSSVSQFTRNHVGRRLKLLMGIAVLFVVLSYGSFKTAVHGAQYWKGVGQLPLEGLVHPEWIDALTPDDPPPEELPPGFSILPEVDVDHLAPPVYKPFPKDLMNELYANAGYPNSPDRYVDAELPDDAFAKHWRSPQWYAQAATHNAAERDRIIPRVQYDFAAHPESEERRRDREERKEAVKRGFVYAWQKYKEHAWGEVHG